MNTRLKSIAACLALTGTPALTPGLAAAQEATPPQADKNTIIVEGARIERDAVRETAREVTARPRTYSDPLPRFQKPICPGIWGMLPENAQPVIDRIYDNAERAGIDIETDPLCTANVWIIVVDDPDATFADLRRERSFMIRELTLADRREVESQTGPARSWSIVSYRNRDGELVPGLSPESRFRNGGPTVNPVTNMSRLESAMRLDMEASVLLLARSALADVDAFTLADYATMRLLAQTRVPEDGGAVDTVLALFDEGADAPQRLSRFDLAYLQALYRSSPTRPGRMAVGNVGTLMDDGVPGQR